MTAESLELSMTDFKIAFANALLFKRSEIKAIKNQDFSSPDTLKAAKKILRLAIDHHLDGKELNSKKVFQSITSKKKAN